jgi:hypothetical protein
MAWEALFRAYIDFYRRTEPHRFPVQADDALLSRRPFMYFLAASLRASHVQ